MIKPWLTSIGLLILLLLLVPVVSAYAASGTPALPAKDYSADRFDAQITVQNDGTLLVQETVVFKFVGGPFTFVYRDIPTDKTDSIAIQSAYMDDRLFSEGTGSDQVEIMQDNPIQVKWHFAPTSDATHTFVLNYLVQGVVQKEQNADALYWEALPTQYDYTIRSSTIMVTYPQQATLLDSPQVRQGIATISTVPNEVTFSASNLSANTSLEIGLRFAPGSLITQPPHWQQQQESVDALILPFFSAGIVVFLLGTFLLILYYRRQRRHIPFDVEQNARLSEPPDDLPPAIAGTLLHSKPSWNQALATLFDLADRGIVGFVVTPYDKLGKGFRWEGEQAQPVQRSDVVTPYDKSGKGFRNKLEWSKRLCGKWFEIARQRLTAKTVSILSSPSLSGSRRPFHTASNIPETHYLLEPSTASRTTRDNSEWSYIPETHYLLERRYQPDDLALYERVLLTRLFPNPQHNTIAMTRLSEVYSSHAHFFTELLEGEMRARGFFDPQRQRFGTELGAISKRLFFFSAVGIIISLIAQATSAALIVFPALGLLAIGIVAYFLRAKYSDRSEQGEQEARRWQAFSHYLKDMSTGQQPIGSPALFGQYLPYATSFGLLGNWITCFQRQGLIKVPSWFQALALAPNANHTAFTNMMFYTITIHPSSSSSSGGSHGGGGGGAGGGASGAG